MNHLKADYEEETFSQFNLKALFTGGWNEYIPRFPVIIVIVTFERCPKRIITRTKHNALHKRLGGFLAKSALMQMLGALAHFENKPFPSTKSNRKSEAPQYIPGINR